ncbi:unnamed protein product, partial [Mesorhabditis spiculigera]
MRLGQGYSLKPRKSSFTWISLILCSFRLSAARDELPTRDAEKGPYFCGANSASAWGSYFMTLSCDQDSINSCCAVHDSCYATCILPQMECDEHFLQLLEELARLNLLPKPGARVALLDGAIPGPQLHMPGKSAASLQPAKVHAGRDGATSGDPEDTAAEAVRRAAAVSVQSTKRIHAVANGPIPAPPRLLHQQQPGRPV